MRRLLTLLLVLPGVLLPAAGAAARLATVRASDTPVFGAPFDRAPVLANCSQGSVIRVLRVNEDWIKVRTEKGRVGFMQKDSVVPGQWDLSRRALQAPGMRRGSGSPPPSRTRSPGPRGDRRTIARPIPARPIPARPGPSPDRGTRNVTAYAGMAMATNTYRLQSDEIGKTVGAGDLPYAGIDAGVEWWPHRNGGGRARLTSTMGWTAGQIPSISKTVSKVPVAMDRVEADALARTIVRPGGMPLRIQGGVGFRIHQLRVDSVVSDGEPVFMVGRTYRGLALVAGIEVPIGSPDRIFHATAEHWFGASVTEMAGSPTGSPGGVRGSGISAGSHFLMSNGTTLDVSLRYQKLDARFGGSGSRFGQAISGAKSGDQSLLLTAAVIRRF